MTTSELAIGIGVFVVDDAGSRSLELQSAPKVRAASVVKPLLAWAAATQSPFIEDRTTWAALAWRSITVSDNEAVAALWRRTGKQRLLVALNGRTRVPWCIDEGGEHASLRIMVTAGELAAAYAELASDGTDVGHQIRRWMREVPAEQTFGARGVACDMLGVAEQAVGVKCGWFGGERAHAIVLAETRHGTVGAAVTTSRAPDVVSDTALKALGNDARLAAVHDTLAGEDIRSAIRRAFGLAGQL